MGAINNMPINFDGHTRFKIKNGETYTVPDVVTAPSPTNASSGVFPTTTFDAKRAAVGAWLYDAFNDGAGPGILDFSGIPLLPGDVVVLSAVASNTINVTVNGVLRYQITGVTTTGGVLGVVG